MWTQTEPHTMEMQSCNVALNVDFCHYSVFDKIGKHLLFFTSCVNFMINGPQETAQNDLEKTLVPLTYIKSKVGFFLLL